MPRSGLVGFLRLGFVGLVVLVAGSCGSGGALPPDGDSGNSGEGGLIADFDSIQTYVFDQLCVSCHSGAAAPLGLRLDAANSYALLVGIASGQNPGIKRVEPGNPAASYLIQKLEGSAGTGGQMPLNFAPMPQSDIDVVRQWIIDGALPSMPDVPPSDPIRVTSLDPLPGSEITGVPTTIMAIFDRELDANTVNATTFMVERSGGDGTFGDGNEVSIVPVSVTVPGANPRSAVFDMSTTPAVEDVYRVILVGSGPAVISDLDANALDGELADSLPSGDGTAGGNFVAQFTVAGIQPTLESIQEHIFTTTCAGCHTGPVSNTLPSGLDLTSVAMSYASLVGVASLEEPSIERVAAGDSDNSYIVHKLEGTATVGGQMPLLGTPLDAAAIAAIRQWIDNGAAP